MSQEPPKSSRELSLRHYSNRHSLPPLLALSRAGTMHFNRHRPSNPLASASVHLCMVCGLDRFTLNLLLVKFASSTNEIEVASNRIEELVRECTLSGLGLYMHLISI